MTEAFNEIQEFVSSYFEVDLLQKCEELFNNNKDKLTEKEKQDLLCEFSKEGAMKVFVTFNNVMDMQLEFNDAINYVVNFFEVGEKNLVFLLRQKMTFEGIEAMAGRIDEQDQSLFWKEVMVLAVKYRYIYMVQKMMQMRVDATYKNQNGESAESLIGNIKDKTMAEYVRYYIQNGQIKEDCGAYFVDNKYTPEYYEEDVDYFATKGLEVCKEVLKSYRKSKLLNDQTTLKELNDFIDKKYNWDDGVEVPYFIMRHKNCDLNLRKKIFELGAGDSIDADTYVNTKKDPWKQFILELDAMIKAEEK